MPQQDFAIDALLMPDDEKFSLFDSGIFNDIVKGYLLDALGKSGCNADTVLRKLNLSLASVDAQQASEIYHKWDARKLDSRYFTNPQTTKRKKGKYRSRPGERSKCNVHT